jgi:hypothetical protein
MTEPDITIAYKGKVITISHRNFVAIMDHARSFCNQLILRQEDTKTTYCKRLVELRNMAVNLAYEVDC